ncbi:hypothetical protein ABIB56_003496 [Glaciihabitans sp. UYNi722]
MAGPRPPVFFWVGWGGAAGGGGGGRGGGGGGRPPPPPPPPPPRNSVRSAEQPQRKRPTGQHLTNLSRAAQQDQWTECARQQDDFCHGNPLILSTRRKAGGRTDRRRANGWNQRPSGGCFSPEVSRSRPLGSRFGQPGLPVSRYAVSGTGYGLPVGVAVRRCQRRPVVVVVAREIPEPILTGLETLDDRMPGLLVVRGGVLRQRIVTAADVPALRTAAQVEPPSSGRLALHASGAARWDSRIDARRGNHGYRPL